MLRTLALLSVALSLPACGGQSGQNVADSQQQAGQGADSARDGALTAQMNRINTSAPEAAPRQGDAGKQAGQQAPDPFIIHLEVLLARARFSPGVIDGQSGTNLTHALEAYQAAHNLPGKGLMNGQTWQALVAQPGNRPVAQAYTITQADIAGPFAPDVGEDMVKLAALPQGPLFTNVVEALAERFHMSQALLRALNPGTAFTTAGQRILIVDAAPAPFARGDVARIDVAKSDASVHVYDDEDRLIAFYPATVGSSERPSPSGLHKVVGVAHEATYTYDPAKLAWGPRSAGKLVIKPGPNNPVGMVWIDLNAPSYGLHGTPDPDNIGKTASHGCVRLTNWDAQALAGGVRPGVTVRFKGERGDPRG